MSEVGLEVHGEILFCHLLNHDHLQVTHSLSLGLDLTNLIMESLSSLLIISCFTIHDKALVDDVTTESTYSLLLCEPVVSLYIILQSREEKPSISCPPLKQGVPNQFGFMVFEACNFLPFPEGLVSSLEELSGKAIRD